MSRRPLVLALAFALLPVAGAHAEDLLQTYELARAGDPQLSAAESSRLATKEGAVQARAALLPQIGGDASYTKLAAPTAAATRSFAGTAAVTSDSSQRHHHAAASASTLQPDGVRPPQLHPPATAQQAR